MSQHTPTPWRRSLTETSLILAGPYAVAAVLPNRPAVENYANADLIVRAVNAHDALVAACRNLLPLALKYYRSLPDDGPEQDHYMTAVIEPAETALAAAEKC
jgi:hypothetical protein